MAVLGRNDILSEQTTSSRQIPNRQVMGRWCMRKAFKGYSQTIASRRCRSRSVSAFAVGLGAFLSFGVCVCQNTGTMQLVVGFPQGELGKTISRRRAGQPSENTHTFVRCVEPLSLWPEKLCNSSACLLGVMFFYSCLRFVSAGCVHDQYSCYNPSLACEGSATSDCP